MGEVIGMVLRANWLPLRVFTFCDKEYEEVSIGGPLSVVTEQAYSPSIRKLGRGGSSILSLRHSISAHFLFQGSGLKDGNIVRSEALSQQEVETLSSLL